MFITPSRAIRINKGKDIRLHPQFIGIKQVDFFIFLGNIFIYLGDIFYLN